LFGTNVIEAGRGVGSSILPLPLRRVGPGKSGTRPVLRNSDWRNSHWGRADRMYGDETSVVPDRRLGQIVSVYVSAPSIDGR
jgi:hypothetical protein